MAQGAFGGEAFILVGGAPRRQPISTAGWGRFGTTSRMVWSADDAGEVRPRRGARAAKKLKPSGVECGR